MSWGSGPFGITPWGGGDVAGLRLVSADAIRENVIRLQFSDPVYFSRWHDPADASFIDRYTITADPTAIGLDGQPSRPVLPADVQAVFGDPTQIDLWLDRSMSPYGSKYSVSVTKLQSTTGVPLDLASTSAVVDGVRQGFPIITANTLIGNRDIANPQSLGAMQGQASQVSALGTFQYDDTGDVGFDEGFISWKKRVFRRLTTRRGSFRHLPSYGITLPKTIKKLARANLVDGIAAEAEEQIRSEPETISASVQLVPHPETPGLFVFRINAETSFGNISNFDVPVPLTT